MSQVLLRRSNLSAIEDHARRALPREACGLLLGHGDEREGFTVTRIVESANVAPPEETGRFEIDPALLLRLHRTLREAPAAAPGDEKAERILGVYHSHPGGRPEPSATDRARAAEPGYVWLITALPSTGTSARAGTAETRAFLHESGLEPAHLVPLDLSLIDG